MVKYIRQSSLILTCQRPVRSSYFFARKEGWRLRAEMEFLTEQLASANGHRRRRASGRRAERASTLGRHAEHRSTPKRLVQALPVLDEPLARRIRTGAFCAYEPDPSRPVAWRL